MNTIVAPTDFSAISLNAVDYAADMAYQVGARLTLLHVCAIPTPIVEVPMPTLNIEDLEESAKVQLAGLKEKLISRIGPGLNIHIVTRAGDIVGEIIDYCATVKPNSVVIGAESSGTLERFFFGGETVQLVNQLKWPLIIVPPQVAYKQIQKIGLACDFRQVVETIRIQEFKNLLEQFNAELHVLHVREDIGDVFSAETVEESALLQEMLSGFNPRYHFIYGVEVEKAISDFADRNKLDLLIIIPKKHNLVGQLFKHSHSKRLVLQTNVPVMAIHE